MQKKPLRCPECGITFIPKTNNQKYCCRKCRDHVISRDKRSRLKARAEMDAIREKRGNTNIIGIAPLDQLSEDQLLHYGRTSREAQLRSGKKEEKQ